MTDKKLFNKLKEFKAPSTILFRGIELKLIKRRFNRLFKKGSVLDLGCGDGITSLIVFEKKIDFGLDDDATFLERAKQKKAYKKILLSDAKTIPLKGNSVRLVFSNCVLEHIPGINVVLKEITRILKPKGKLIFTTPSDNFKKYSLLNYLGLKKLGNLYTKLRDKKLNHYNCHSLNGWKKILNKSGLKVIDHFYYIDRKTSVLWDLLFLLNPFFSTLLPKFPFWKLIKGKLKTANFTDQKGAAICILAEKT